MHIAIDCRLIGSSGIGTFIENIIQHVVMSEKHLFLLIGDPVKLKQYSSLENCHIKSCTYKSFSLEEMLFFPCREVNKCDAFYTPNFNIPKGIKVPVFSTIHDIVFFRIPEICPVYQKPIFMWYISRALRISKCIFTVSQFTKNEITDFFKSETPIKVVHSAINQAMIDYKSTRETPKDRSGIIFLGNLKKHKGIRILIKAYYKLLNDGYNEKLTIIGKFDFRSKDSETIRLLKKCNDRIEFINGASNEEVYRRIASAKVLVSPSLYEGFGLPPLEAMFLGTPAIISDIPVYKEIYEDFPVTFFKSNNADDLYKKLRQYSYSPLDVEELIHEHYNFKKSAKEILTHIEENLYK